MTENNAQNPQVIEDQPTSNGLIEGKPKGYDDAMIVYILYGLSFVIGITWIGALIYAYIKRDDLKDTIYYSHMNYVIRSCWWGLGLMILGFVLMFVLIGLFVIIGVSIWLLYRGIKGFIYFKDGKAIN